ncbi:MAG: UvrD-helicase domain-containing protein, partial [Spirochaetales bacterium]|nr:UvrD-helicase domain-containing protein [Spirochaetales bacterium]
KLFFVGDEKQSIYRFRGADVSVFKALGDELRSIGGKEFTLNTNYRSEPALIEWFNNLFDTVMTNEGQSWEADFTTLGTRLPSEGINASIKLMIKAFTEAEEDEAKSSDAEALAIADLVEEMLYTDSYLIPSKEGPRRPEPSDIALLMRTTGNQLSFEKALRRKKIPYSVQAARSLMLEALANDCYAMLQLALYPEDTLSYLVVLRSPFCNLNDDSIVRLSHAELFSESVELEEAERRRLMRCKDFYERLRSLLGSRSLSELVQMIFYESGYYLHLVSRAEYQVYMEHYTFLHRLAQMHQEMGRSVSQFVDYLRQHLGTAEKIDELEVIKEQESGVQIMSIHKSKGLEFPIVIVVDTGSKPKGERDVYSTFANVPLPHYLDRQAYESATKQITIRHAGQLGEREIERARSVAELKRLLYVALTRSETHLVFSGCFTKANRGLTDDGVGDTLLLQLCRALGIAIDDPQYEEGIVTTVRIEPALESSLYETGREKDAIFLQRVGRMSQWYEGARALPPVQPIRVAATRLRPSLSTEEGIHLPELASDSILSGSDDLAMAFGTLVHALIEDRIKGEIRPMEGLIVPLTRLIGAHDVHQLAEDAV